MDGLISFETMKMIEFIFLFGLPFVFGYTQLRALKRLKEADEAKARAAAMAADKPAAPG